MKRQKKTKQFPKIAKHCLCVFVSVSFSYMLLLEKEIDFIEDYFQ